MSEPLKILSLGAGVQSSTVLMMSVVGELPKLDHAIFADTGWEPAAVYAQLDWLEKQATAAGIQVHRVHKSNLRDDALRSQVRGKKDEDGGRWASLPYFTRDRTTGKPGMIRRQCTSEYKIYPIQRKLRELIGLKKGQQGPKTPVVEQWFGISADEPGRMRGSDTRWITNRYPLIYDRRMKRADCLAWMLEHGLPKPPRSACIGCPFHSDAEWREMKTSRLDEWSEAVSFDKAIRTCGGTRGDVFLHAQRVPLEEVDLSTAADRGQLSLFDNECAGVCGV